MNTNTATNTTAGGLILPTGNRWREVENILVRHYFEPDLQAARAFYSAIAAHRLTGQPVWPMLVGPPGSMKTELLNGLQGLKSVHFIDQVTAQTFISGQIVEGKKQAPPGLLHRIGSNGILVYPDFSTILAMKAEAKASILADMRRIYDGQLRKEFGTANNVGEREWKGRITFAVAATPDVDAHYGIFQTLGERFLMIRWDRPNGVQAALTAMNQDGALAKRELQSAVAALFGSLRQIEPVLSEDLQHSVAALADFVTRARTHVHRSGYTKGMVYAPSPEAPTRLGQQLAQLAKGSALLDGRSEVNEADYALVKRVAFDCIPTLRRKVVRALICDQELTSIAPATTLKYCLEDLEALELIEKRTLSALSINLLTMAGMMEDFTRTPTPSRMIN